MTVCSTLEQYYGRSRLGNPSNPVDDFIFITLSNKSSPETATKIYYKLKNKFNTWDSVLTASQLELQKIIQPSGLSRIKSKYIWLSLEKMKDDFGTCTLDPISDSSEDAQLKYLLTLPGVSGKVARCIMLFTMGADVLPVDSHVHRVSTRLGWVSRKRADQCHAELEAIVPRSSRYIFHVGSIQHGREICRPRSPNCHKCVIRDNCMFYHRNFGKQGE
jgi:endonuclease III